MFDRPSVSTRLRLGMALGRADLRGLSTRILRLFVRLVPSERHRVFVLTIVIGVVCGLAAVAFHSTIRLATKLFEPKAALTPSYATLAWLVLTPAVGALIVGTLLEYLAPNARGSGIPQVKLAFAVKSKGLRLRDAVSKFGLASIQLGTGSALGREGPTVQICATLASALGRMLAISPHSMRRLIPVGAAAGIAAAFNAPVAAVTFTIEEIVGDLDQTVLSGVVVAAALAAAVEHSILGEHPVYDVPASYGLTHASSLLIYALLGVAAALVARLFYRLLLGIRAHVRETPPARRALVPALGGLCTGMLAALVSATMQTSGVLGDGYETLSAALVGNLPLHILLALVVAKVMATVLCYSTGGAGGIFAPVLFIGGMLGGAFGHLDAFAFPAHNSELGAFALVGMGAFFAAVIRAPITSVLIIFEMTRGYGLILPLMIANTVAYALARSWDRTPIYEALLAQDGLEIPQVQRAAATLSSFRVADTMTTELVTLRAEDTVEQALKRIEGLEFSMYPVLSEDGSLLGLVSESRLRRRLAEQRAQGPIAADAKAHATLQHDQPLVDAIALMNRLGERQMAVVNSQTNKLVGMLAMSDVMRAHARALTEQHGAPVAEDYGARGAVSWRPRDSTGTTALPSSAAPTGPAERQ